MHGLVVEVTFTDSKVESIIFEILTVERGIITKLRVTYSDGIPIHYHYIVHQVTPTTFCSHFYGVDSLNSIVYLQ